MSLVVRCRRPANHDESCYCAVTNQITYLRVDYGTVEDQHNEPCPCGSGVSGYDCPIHGRFREIEGG